jgi:hypothetical protein
MCSFINVSVCAAVPLRVQQQKKVFFSWSCCGTIQGTTAFPLFLSKVMYRLRFHTGNNSENPILLHYQPTGLVVPCIFFASNRGVKKKKIDFCLICLFVHFWWWYLLGKKKHCDKVISFVMIINRFIGLRAVNKKKKKKGIPITHVWISRDLLT